MSGRGERTDRRTKVGAYQAEWRTGVAVMSVVVGRKHESGVRDWTAAVVVSSEGTRDGDHSTWDHRRLKEQDWTLAVASREAVESRSSKGIETTFEPVTRKRDGIA